MARQIVSRGEKKSLQGVRSRSNVLNLGSVVCGPKKFADFHVLGEFEFAGNVEHSFALANGKRQVVGLPVCQLPEDFLASERMIKEILTSLQRAPWMATRVNFEGDGAANHALFCEDMGRGAARGSVGNLHVNPFRRNSAEGLFDGIPEIAGDGSGSDQKNEQ